MSFVIATTMLAARATHPRDSLAMSFFVGFPGRLDFDIGFSCKETP